MNSERKIFSFIIGFVLIGLAVAAFFPKEEKMNKDAAIRIGAGDDISGMLMEEIVSDLSGRYQIEDAVESSSFQDCWSNLAQWALGAEEINIAFYCGHVAAHTINENENVMIYGPVIMNAELICYKEDWESVRTVGISQGRELEKELAKKTYPQIETFQDITQKGIFYSLEDDQVDAIIQDLKKAAALPDYNHKPLSENDFISYVLVVDKEFARTEEFAGFLESYNKAVEKLNEPAYLAEKLNVDESWLENKEIKFLTLD